MRLFKRSTAARKDHKPTWRERRAAARTAEAEARLRRTEQEIHDLLNQTRDNTSQRARRDVEEQKRIYEKQCAYPGGLLSIDFKGGKPAAFEFLRNIRIARNAVIDRRRRNSVRPALSVYEETPETERGELDESIEQAALRWQMAAALAKLTPEHREVVRLAHYEGMTMREIADAKGLPIGTIKSRAWYAMRSLRLTLEEMEGTA